MTGSVPRNLSAVMVIMLGSALSGCVNGGFPSFTSEQPPPPAAAPLPRAAITPEDIVGRWGLAAFHKPEDRARTEKQASSQCKQPYEIHRSPTGVAMLGHDNPAVQDMVIKASQDGKTYIGPDGEPGGADDRELVSYDGRVLLLKWVDPEVAGRYGTMTLVRCGPEGTAPKVARAKVQKPRTPKPQNPQ